MPIARYAGPGAPPSRSKPWKRGTPSSRSTKSGIFPPEQCRTGLFANYVVKVKTRIGGVAKLVPDWGAETGLHSSLPGTGGHPTGHRQHCQKSRTQGYRQADAEQLLVQIRRTCQQTHHRHSQGARPFVQSHLQCHSRYQHSPPLYRRYLGGRLHQRPRECGQRDQNEHLRSGFRQGAMLSSNFYESLDTLQQQVLYYDTDSVV